MLLLLWNLQSGELKGYEKHINNDINTNVLTAVKRKYRPLKSMTGLSKVGNGFARK